MLLDLGQDNEDCLDGFLRWRARKRADNHGIVGVSERGFGHASESLLM